MPDASLPSSAAGWIVALGAGIVGFFAGFAWIMFMKGVLGG